MQPVTPGRRQTSRLHGTDIGEALSRKRSTGSKLLQFYGRGVQVMSAWNRRSVAVLGVPFDNVTMHEAMELIEEKIDEQGFHQVATANVDFVIHAMNDQVLQEVLCSCDLIVPDGMPIVWASRLMGCRLKERVSGIDMVPRLAELAARRGWGMFLLGASERSSLAAAEALKKRFPKLQIAGRYCPPVSHLADMDHEEILSRIDRAQPHILLVAMGHPKQEQWLAMHRDRLNVPLCMGVGASLDFLAGVVSRAPLWMQRTGLEWLYRAAQEPQRLTQRYLSDAFGLARHLPIQVAANAIQPRKHLNAVIETERFSMASVIAVTGDISPSMVHEFEEHLDRAHYEDRDIILDLSETAYFGLDSVALLVHLAKVMKRQNRHFWLAGVPGHVTRIFRAARMNHYFVTVPSVRDALYRLRKSESRILAQSATLTYEPSTRDASIQVEILKDFCRRIVFLSQRMRASSERRRSETPATP
jgi:N-acetylglucosaminyldiphosphoundecaprenol N-acetyl-beta-D-mannosaminyltransferase